MLNCFGMARYTQVKANDKTMAIMKAQTVFEYIKASKNVNEMDEVLKSTFEISAYDKVSNKYSYTDYYDKDWNKCDEVNKEYFITLLVSSEQSNTGDMKDIEVTVEKVKKYPFFNKWNPSIINFRTKMFFPNFLVGRQ